MKIGPLEIKWHKKARWVKQPNMVWQCPSCGGVSKLGLVPDGRTVFQVIMDARTKKIDVMTLTCSECKKELKIMAFDQVVVELAGMVNE